MPVASMFWGPCRPSATALDDRTDMEITRSTMRAKFVLLSTMIFAVIVLFFVTRIPALSDAVDSTDPVAEIRARSTGRETSNTVLETLAVERGIS